MSRTARSRGKGRRIQPYAWLGAGAVTLGLGAAMVSGTAVAFAETGADEGPTAASAGSTTETSATPTSGTEAAAAPKRKKAAVRSARGEVAEHATQSGAAVQTRASVAAAVSDDLTETEAGTESESAVRPAEALADPAAVDVLDGVEPMTAGNSVIAPAPAPRGLAGRGQRVAVTETAVTETAVPVAAVDVELSGAGAAAGAGAVAASAAVVPGAAANPAPNMTSWLPDTPIVPGAHVQLALQEIAAAQGVIQDETWGSGNFIAGLAAIVPQVFLAGAALSLTAWQATNPGAQQFLAAVAGIPIVAQVAQLNLVGTMLWPNFADLSLAGAELFLPVVGLFGAPDAVTLGQPLIAAARQDGKVYAVVPLQVKLSTQPVATVSINNGSRTPLLVDTGASGIVVLPSAVPNIGQLVNIGSGDSCFSGGLCYHYETYETSVDFGGGAFADSTTVNIVTNNDEYPESVADFQEYFSWGADGIMGVGANTAGPGPAPIPNTDLPGELSTGVLIFQNFLPFGLGGLMVFGPNALPTRVSLPGAPDAYVTVSVNGGALTDAGSIIDSGGVYGTLPLANAPAGSVAGQNLPAGTRIAVYAPDETTLLYTFTTLSGLSGTPVIETGLMNTGNAPYQQNPIYMNYAGPDGIGSTDFSIW